MDRRSYARSTSELERSVFDFQRDLGAAIQAAERFERARSAQRHADELRQESPQLIDTSRGLLDDTRRRLGKPFACVECRIEDDGERGWRVAEADLDVIVAYCPDCWEREFVR